MTSSGPSTRATVLCAGIAVQDILFRVDALPPPGGKTMTHDFMIVTGGCAANASLAIARLGANSRFSGPVGHPEDSSSKQLLATLQAEGVDVTGVVRVPEATIPVSGIFIDATGERTIVTYRDRRIENAEPPDPDRLVSGITLLLADNRFPDYVRPICEAARRQGRLVVIDGDRPTVETDPLFAIATHIIFSAECLRGTTGENDLDAALLRMARRTKAFLAVSDGSKPVRYIANGVLHRMDVFQMKAVDTLGAGDVFHAGFALALAEGRDEVAALRFGSAAAAIKITRFGGSMGAPSRAEVDAFLETVARK